MAKYDGEQHPVSTFLGTEYRATFLARYTVPLFGRQAVGFDLAPPTEVSGRITLNPNLLQVPNAVTDLVPENESEYNGFYQLKYFLEPRIAALPRAYRHPVSGEGPVDLFNMWNRPRIHFSSL